jgi:hypothetical protein
MERALVSSGGNGNVTITALESAFYQFNTPKKRNAAFVAVSIQRCEANNELLLRTATRSISLVKVNKLYDNGRLQKEC